MLLRFGIPPEAFLESVQVIAGERVLRRADAMLACAALFGPLEWIRALGELPGMRTSLNRLYDRVAKSRSRSCAIPPRR